MTDQDPDWIEQQLAKQNVQNQIDQLAETLRAEIEGDQYRPPDERGIDTHRIDWIDLLSTTPDLESRWLIPDLVAAGRNHALVATAGAGKSELLLWAIARAAYGAGIYGEPITPVRTLYLDYEMGPDDLRERMQSFAYTPDDDLSNLIYLQPPELEALDRPPYSDVWPGKLLVEYAQQVEADLVVIDTFSRSVDGEENSNDTVRNYYRNTGTLLKTAGIAQIRLDHVGHMDQTRARGGSAKSADIDVSIILSSDKTANLTTLKRGKARMAWWPEQVEFRRWSDGTAVRYETIDRNRPEPKPADRRYDNPEDLVQFLRELYPTSRPTYQIAHDALAAIGASWKSREVLRAALDLWPIVGDSPVDGF